MTPEQAKALGYLSGRTFGSTVEEFSRFMWPTSPSWTAVESPGKGACYSGSVMLNRLIDHGWAERAQTDPVMVFRITRLGLGALTAHQNKQSRTSAQRVHQAKRPCGSPAGRTRRAWKDVTCPGCLRHRPRGGSRTTNRRSRTSRSRKG